MRNRYDYEQLKDYIQKGRAKTERQIGNNTEARINHDGAIVVTLHSTDIAILYPDGRVTLNSGSWHTLTTKDRLNWFIPNPYRVAQEDYVWYVWDYEMGKNLVTFYNGITFIPVEDGYLIGK